MEALIKNIKQIALVLVVCALAIGTISYASAKLSKSGKEKAVNAVKKKRAITVDHVVQLSATNFQGIANLDNGSCNGASSERYCSYDVTTTGMSNIPNNGPFTAAQIDEFVDDGYLVENSEASRNLWVPIQ